MVVAVIVRNGMFASSGNRAMSSTASATRGLPAPPRRRTHRPRRRARRLAGSTAPGEPHHYRLNGPRLLVEWDNTQRNVNHAHAVWRDPESDFGRDVLAAHRA
jgi:hypothetical protein